MSPDHRQYIECEGTLESKNKVNKISLLFNINYSEYVHTLQQ